jgi:hypothetical protein
VVTVPLSVLTGASSAPAVMAGYGPIPAQLAREIAADAVWRCAVIDDDPTSATHATLLGRGRSSFTPAYLPGPGTRRFIAARDGTCRFPGCRAPARRCDTDHRIPHARGGPTCDCNLQALCGYHHRLKHETPITVRPAGPRTAPGRAVTGSPDTGRRDTGRRDAPNATKSADTLIWTMPSGRTYTTDPEPPPF